jgi:hypothetical protein
MKRTLLLMGLLAALHAAGCSPAESFRDDTTDLFLVPMWSDAGLVMVGEATNLTRRAGYDNQPAFLPEGRALLYASRDARQSDVYRYDLDSDQAVQLTRGVEREYSPQAIPGGGFSAVRVEQDGRVRLWRFEDDGGQGEPIRLGTGDPVQYYCWADATTVALVLDDDPAPLHLADVASGVVRPVTEDVGRSLNRVPDARAISFVHRESPAHWWIKRLDLDSGEITRVAPTIQGREDHAWTSSGSLVMARGSRLYLWIPGQSETWREIEDLASDGLSEITRLAASPDGQSLVLVAEPRD